MNGVLPFFLMPHLFPLPPPQDEVSNRRDKRPFDYVYMCVYTIQEVLPLDFSSFPFSTMKSRKRERDGRVCVCVGVIEGARLEPIMYIYIKYYINICFY